MLTRLIFAKVSVDQPCMYIIAANAYCPNLFSVTVLPPRHQHLYKVVGMKILVSVEIQTANRHNQLLLIDDQFVKYTCTTPHHVHR